MLTLKRKIKPPNVDLDRLKELIVSKPNGTLNKIKRVKSFLEARVNGKTVKEAKALSGVPMGLPVKTIVSEPVAEILLGDLLKDHGFGNIEVKDKLRQLWDAEDPIVSKFGVVGKKPNWEAQHKALDQVLHLRGFKKKEVDASEDRPVSVVFNVMTMPDIVDVKSVENTSK